MTKLDAALVLAQRGFKVFPLTAGAKAPPIIARWPVNATSDAETVNRWWVNVPDANIGIHCAGMLVVDVDVKKGGDSSLFLLEMEHGELPKTLTTRTPTGGRHLFYRVPADVRNGVDVLGPGLDVRARGGYVVAPGSSVPAGRYKFEEELEIADAPEWLVALVGLASAERERRHDHDVPDAPDQVYARAVEYLQRAPRSVKGAGGDETAYKVACMMRDMGLSYHQACEAMRSEAWDYGCGWRAGWLEEKPIASAYRYAQSDRAGSKAALPEDFPDLTEERKAQAAAPAAKPRGGPIAMADFAALRRGKGSNYLVKGLLDRGTYGEIYGPSGEGKTFVVMDIGYHIALGKEWMGHKVRQADVLYVGFEAFGGLATRAQALMEKYDRGAPMYFLPGDFNLREPEGRQALGQSIAALPNKPGLIVIDTFAYALMGGDENSAQDVQAFNVAVQALIANTGATVLIIHHTGKDESKGARGSSAMKAAVDTEIMVSGRRIVPTKQRDMEIVPAVGFKLQTVVLGTDEDGDAITSCVIEQASDAGAPKANVKPGSASQIVLDMLAEIRPDNAPVTDEQLWQACEPFLAGRAAYRKGKFTLKHQRVLVIDEDGMITRRLE